MAPIFDIDEKLRQYLEGSASQEVLDEVRTWADSDPDHQAQLEQLEALWGRAAGSALFREIDPHADWHKVRQRLQASETAPSGGSSTSSNPGRRRIWAVAAAVLLLASLSFFFLRDNGKPGMLVAETGDQPREILLADGSQVTLRPHSRLEYPEEFTGEQRSLELEAGEAFFDVQRKPEQPFVVLAGPSRVEVLGTSFSVQRQGEQTQVAVRTGKVRFYIPDKASADIVLSPGQKARLDPESKTPHPVATRENQFSWTTGRLVFDQTPIRDVLDDLSLHFNVSISTGTQLDDSLKLTTEFIDQSLEEVLSEMKVVLGIGYRIENDKVFVE